MHETAPGGDFSPAPCRGDCLHAAAGSRMPIRGMNPSEKTLKLFTIIQRQAGVSRRKAQELVAAGEVSVDGAVLQDPYQTLDPEVVERVSLRGHPLSLHLPEHRVYRLHKPKGMLCSHDDPHEGNTVGRVLRSEGFIGYSWAGRLDQDAEGLLLVTNDGGLLNGLTHPRYEVAKTYHVWVDRLPARAAADTMLREMQRGILDEGDRLRILAGRVTGRPPYVVLQLTEGRKREIKRLFGHYDLRVIRLLRVAIGPVQLGTLRPGTTQRLTAEEIEQLRRAVRTSERS